MGFDVERAQCDFWGPAWILTDGHQNKVVLVEHETGLEILAVAGSVASLIALVPAISSGWNKLRDRFLRHHMDRGSSGLMQVRRFNQTSVLVEQQAPSVEVYLPGATLNHYDLMKQRVGALEIEVARLKQKLVPGASKGTARSRAKSNGKR